MFRIYLIITLLTLAIFLSGLLPVNNFLPTILTQKIKLPQTKLALNPKTEASPSSAPTSIPTPTPSYLPYTFGNQIKVPMLLYHYVGNNPNPADKRRDDLSVTPDKFEEQMKYLVDNGYHTTSLDTLYAALKKQISLPDKSVILTFDDGYVDFYYNAYPILKKYNLSATVFIPTGLMGGGAYLTWLQIQEMHSSGRITFGSHLVHHYHLPSLSRDAALFELKESKRVLQNQLGVPINFLAYPYGSTNTNIIELVKEAGYVGAVGTWAGKIQSEGTIFDMPRLRVGGGVDIGVFLSFL